MIRRGKAFGVVFPPNASDSKTSAALSVRVAPVPPAAELTSTSTFVLESTLYHWYVSVPPVPAGNRSGVSTAVPLGVARVLISVTTVPTVRFTRQVWYRASIRLETPETIASPCQRPAREVTRALTGRYASISLPPSVNRSREAYRALVAPVTPARFTVKLISREPLAGTTTPMAVVTVV